MTSLDVYQKFGAVIEFHFWKKNRKNISKRLKDFFGADIAIIGHRTFKKMRIQRISRRRKFKPE